MYLKNEDFELLLNIEMYLYCSLSNEDRKMYLDLYNLIERLMKQKEIKNKKNWERIKNKRKIDKNYGRSHQK